MGNKRVENVPGVPTVAEPRQEPIHVTQARVVAHLEQLKKDVANFTGVLQQMSPNRGDEWIDHNRRTMVGWLRRLAEQSANVQRYAAELLGRFGTE